MMDPNITDIYYKAGACSSPTPPCGTQQWIDPCSCDSYYFCVPTEPSFVIKQQCANGTAWKIPGQACDFDYNVHGIYCNPENPLERCPISTWDNFKHIVCSSSQTSTSASTSSTQLPDVTADGRVGGDNSGLIAGIVVPIIIVILVVVLVLVMWRRGWKLPSKLMKPFQRKKADTKREPTETTDDHIYADIQYGMNIQPMPSPAFTKHSDGFAKGDSGNSTNHAGILPPPRIINRPTRNDNDIADYDNPGFDPGDKYNALSSPRVVADNDYHQYTHLYADGDVKDGARSTVNSRENDDIPADGYYIIEKDGPAVM